MIAGRVHAVGSCSRTEDGRLDCGTRRRSLDVVYGIESYFVPQGTGRAIERTERNRLEVVAAVSPSGQAAIKRLLNPEDIAALASYVASPAAWGMTGAVLDLDLGWTAR
mgnify:CR=1 FL=1